MATPALNLNKVTKEFRKDKNIVRAVDAIDLSVNEGEMVVFLGPSGCGKTTTLRMVAGFEIPTSGTITIKGEEMTNVPVNKRGIGFVFQNYALFPHMSVGANVAYGLKSRGERDADIAPKVKSSLELVGLAGAENRFPNQLSGGEQQRVALARVLVMEPKLLLMDEPLSNLDAKLRIHMRTEIRRIQKKLGITCLYVTHDQSEALTVADRIMIMNKGKVEQIGTPLDIYANPRSIFVADFIGQANVVKLTLANVAEGMASAALPGGGMFSARALRQDELAAGKRAALIVRPEHISVSFAANTNDPKEDEGANTKKVLIPAKVLTSTFVGTHVEYGLALADGSTLTAQQAYVPGQKIHTEGDAVHASFDADTALFLPL